MAAVAASPIPALLEKLGPLDADRIADLGPYLESVPDPRSRRGRWYSLTAILLMCACAPSAVRRASMNSPSSASGPRTRCWHPSGYAVTCSRRSPTTASPPIAQVEVGAKTNEVRHFKPLLAPLDLADTVVTFDALHSVKANITWLAETKKAHYIAVIKTNQPTACAQLAALPSTSIKGSSTPPPPLPTAAASPARSKPALSPTTSAASPSPTPTSPSGSTAAASPPAGPNPARTSTRSPASPPIKPAPSTSPPPFAGIGESKILPTTSEMSRSLRTPRPFTPALHPAPWPPSEPRHRHPEDPRSRQHRQDHPRHSPRTRTGTRHPGHHQQPRHSRNLIKPCAPRPTVSARPPRGHRTGAVTGSTGCSSPEGKR